MKAKSKDGTTISRRKMFSLFGGTLLIPLLGFGNPISNEILDVEDDEYQTLLKPDGTIVKVKASTLKKSKIVKKNISNRTFLKWLGR